MPGLLYGFETIYTKHWKIGGSSRDVYTRLSDYRGCNTPSGIVFVMKIPSDDYIPFEQELKYLAGSHPDLCGFSGSEWFKPVSVLLSSSDMQDVIYKLFKQVADSYGFELYHFDYTTTAATTAVREARSRYQLDYTRARRVERNLKLSRLAHEVTTLLNVKLGVEAQYIGDNSVHIVNGTHFDYQIQQKLVSFADLASVSMSNVRNVFWHLFRHAGFNVTRTWYRPRNRHSTIRKRTLQSVYLTRRPDRLGSAEKMSESELSS